jgi:hypothetical protein
MIVAPGLPLKWQAQLSIAHQFQTESVWAAFCAPRFQTPTSNKRGTSKSIPRKPFMPPQKG